MNFESPLARRLGPLALDAVLVIVFAVLGARTHHEGALSFDAVADVAWPFLVGVGIMHAFGRRQWTVKFGVAAWIGVVAIGMIGRQLTGDGTALAFVIVATLFNLVTLVGWRLLAALVSRRRSIAS